MAETPKDRDPQKKPSDDDAVPTSLASSTHVATRRNASGVHPMPQRPAEPLKPTIAEALLETKEAVQEAVRELTGKTVIPVAMLQPTAAQIKAADALAQAQGEPEKSVAGALTGAFPGTASAARPAGVAPGALGQAAQATQAGQSGAASGAPPPGAVQANDLVTLKIDGREVRAKKGTNVLEACLQSGVDVSYFCYHKGLSSPAVCRQCLVEIAGQPKLVPSCYTPVADKMEVITASPKVQLARQQMLEFTLVNHPVDCPICDKAGECTLQKLYMEWDSRESRTDINKVHKPKVVDLGPTIVLDAERCILCTRCIRVCDEVAGQHQLEMAWRGDREQLTVAPGERLDNPYSLNTVDVCPVGALTSKDFRFRMRAWELYTVDSVCPGCATGCNVEIHHHQGEVWRLVPRENPEVNQFWMCDEGRFTYKELRGRRVAGARFGMGRGLPGQIASVERAVAYAAERLGRVCDTKGTIGLCFGAQAQNEALYALQQVADLLQAQGIPVRRYVTGRAPRPEREDKVLRSADVNPNTAGARIMAGAGAGTFETLKADLGAGALKALWLVGEDLPVAGQALDGLLSLLDKLELFIVQAVNDTPVTGRAQVILPAAAWAEVDGTFTNSKGHVQRLRRAIATPGTARPHLELVGLLAQKAGLAKGQGWQGSPRQAFLHMAGALGAQVAPEPSAPSPLRGFAVAEWGRERPPLQLRFANSRG